MAEVAKIYDLNTGKEMVDIKKTNRKTFHVMKDGTMTSYMNQKKTSTLKEKAKQFMLYFFDMEDEFEYKKNN